MRILYLTYAFPYPLTSGYLRHYFLIRELSQRNSITMLSLVPSDFDDEHCQALAPYTDRVLTFRRDGAARSALTRLLLGVRMFVSPEPAVRKMRAAVGAWTASCEFDVVLLSGKHTLPAVRQLHGVPLVADVCDAASLRIRGQLAHVGWAKWPWLLASNLNMRRFERGVIRRAAHLVFASCRDRDALAIGNIGASVVPNGVDANYWHNSAINPSDRNIVFTGAMHYPPNADAALHLIQDILPRVRAEVPEAELSIVGRDPPARLIAAAARSRVNVTGYVKDVRPYLARAAVFAAPMRFGAGIQNKVLEAMAMEVPVIASPTAAAGLFTEDGREPPIEVACGAEEFARALIRRLRAGSRSPHSNASARQYVLEHFCWRRSAEKLERVLRQVVSRSRADVPRTTLDLYGQGTQYAAHLRAEENNDSESS